MDQSRHGNTPRHPNAPQNYPSNHPFFSQPPSQFPPHFSQFSPNMYSMPQNFNSDPSFFQQFMMQNHQPQNLPFHNVEGSFPDARQGNVTSENDLENNEDVAEIDPIHFSPFEGQSKKSWSIAEDEALISSYMNVTTDPIIGTGQKKGDLWKKVGAAFSLAQQDNSHRISARNNESLKGRWRRICASVTKWVGCMDEATKRKRSGMNDEDVIREAHIIYSHQYNSKFFFYDHWKMLLKYPKWEAFVGVSVTPTSNPPEQHNRDSGSSGKRVRLDDDDIELLTPRSQQTPYQFNSDEVEFGSSNRPEGVKKAKGKGKKKVENQTTFLAEKLEVFGSSISEKSKLDQQKLEKKMEAQEKKLMAQREHNKFVAFSAFIARGEDNLSEREKKIYFQLAKELGYDV